MLNFTDWEYKSTRHAEGYIFEGKTFLVLLLWVKNTVKVKRVQLPIIEYSHSRYWLSSHTPGTKVMFCEVTDKKGKIVKLSTNPKHSWNVILHFHDYYYRGKKNGLNWQRSSYHEFHYLCWVSKTLVPAIYTKGSAWDKLCRTKSLKVFIFVLNGEAERLPL